MADEVVKVVVIGNGNVGKTCLINAFLGRDLAALKPTIGVEYYGSHLSIDDKNVRVQLWDTAGQERFRAVPGLFFRRAQAVALVYDVTSYQSFLKADDWYQEAQRYIVDHYTVMLIGNKIDLTSKRQVPTSEAEEYARRKGFYFFETSAVDNTNVKTAFHQLMRESWQQKQRLNTRPDTRDIITPRADDVPVDKKWWKCWLWFR